MLLEVISDLNSPLVGLEYHPILLLVQAVQPLLLNGLLFHHFHFLLQQDPVDRLVLNWLLGAHVVQVSCIVVLALSEHVGRLGVELLLGLLVRVWLRLHASQVRQVKLAFVGLGRCILVVRVLTWLMDVLK